MRTRELLIILIIASILMGFCIGMGSQQEQYEPIIISYQEQVESQGGEISSLNAKALEAEAVTDYFRLELATTTKELMGFRLALSEAQLESVKAWASYHQLEHEFQSFKDTLETDGYIPFLSSKELRDYVHDTGIWENEYKAVVYDCDDFALDLFTQACIDRRPVGLCWDRAGRHMMNFAIVKVRDTYRLYFVNPGDGLVWDSGTRLD